LPDTAGAITCEDGWVAFQGSCYLFGRTAVHFTEAEVGWYDRRMTHTIN